MEERANDEAGETWQKLGGHSIIAGKMLKEKLDEAVKNSLKMLASCLSQESHLAFSTTEKKQGI